MRYEIIVRMHVNTHGSIKFENLSIKNLEDGNSMIYGELRNQAELFGVLKQINRFGLELIELKKIN